MQNALHHHCGRSSVSPIIEFDEGCSGIVSVSQKRCKVSWLRVRLTFFRVPLFQPTLGQLPGCNVFSYTTERFSSVSLSFLDTFCLSSTFISPFPCVLLIISLSSSLFPRSVLYHRGYWGGVEKFRLIRKRKRKGWRKIIPESEVEPLNSASLEQRSRPT